MQPGCLYHVYNHAVGKDNLFLSHDNYSYFLSRYEFFIPAVAETYAFSLLPNHVHFLIEVRTDVCLPTASKLDVPQFVSRQFASLFSSYSQAFNKQQNRRGNLFMSRFRRELVDSDEYISNLIRYIHLNPTNHGLLNDFRDWKYSSYETICSSENTFLSREKVISWFGNLDEFKDAHFQEETHLVQRFEPDENV